MTVRAKGAGHPRNPVLTERLRGAAALGLLILLVIGLPVALWSLGQALSPFPARGRFHPLALLTQPDDGSLLLAALLLLGWLAWLLFALSVVMELVAVLRRTPTPRLPGLRWLQQSSAALVATSTLLVTSGAATMVTPVARPVSATLLVEYEAPPSPTLAAAPVQPATEKADNHPTIEVRRGDTLWSLAETHLGSGRRYREIRALNLGWPQADGRALSDRGWVFPGWTLRLPSDAVFTASTPAEAYTVRPGDTLSEIAVEELGAGSGFAEIFNLNKGHRQPDGRKLSDPDKIQPGWILEVPQPTQSKPVRRSGRAPVGSAHSQRLPPRIAEPQVAVVPPQPADTPSTGKGPSQPAEAGHHNADGSEVTVGIAVGLGAVTATGLVWELRRRRRRQQRSRGPGERIAMPEPPALVTEGQIAALESPVTVETVRHALRTLLASCVAVGRQLPDVLLVRVSSTGVTLELSEDDLGAVPPFVASSARTWRLEGAAEPVDGPDPYPALLTLGIDDEDVLLLNFESIGELRVTGSKELVEEVLRAAALDLAVGPLSGLTTLTFAGCLEQLAQALEPTRTRRVDSPARAGLELEVRRETTEGILAAAGVSEVRAARLRQVAADATTPEVVVSPAPLPKRPEPWSGACVISAGEPGGGCAVTVNADGFAVLQPMGLTFQPHRMPEAGFEQVVALLATAFAAATPVVVEPEQEPAVVVAAALPDVPPPPLELGEESIRPPRVLVLGRVEVEGGNDAAIAHRRRRASELIAYLALHPGASSPEIDEALWPGKRVDKSTRNPFISRARQWLGRTPEGEPYLPLVVDGGSYALRPEVSCDWHDFVSFAKLGLASGPDGEMALAAALDLVRGRPFLGIDPATYTWAEADVQEMISAIVDVAHILSTVRCEAGDHRGAQEAAAQGLMVEPCSELLYRDAMTAAAGSGDHDEVQRLADRLRREVALLDPDDSLGEVTSAFLGTVPA